MGHTVGRIAINDFANSTGWLRTIHVVGEYAVEPSEADGLVQPHEHGKTRLFVCDCSISREELRLMFEYVVGGMSVSPNKFTSLLKHHRMHLKVVWIAPKSVNQTKALWKDVAQFPAYGREHVPVAVAPGTKPLKLVPTTKSPKAPKMAAA